MIGHNQASVENDVTGSLLYCPNWPRSAHRPAGYLGSGEDEHWLLPPHVSDCPHAGGRHCIILLEEN